MKKFSLFCIGAVLGGAVGFTVGNKTSKKKYLAYADSEIESVKELYEEHFKNNNGNEEKLEEPKKKKEPVMMSKNSTNAEKNTYNDYAKVYKNDEGAGQKKFVNAYIIPPEEFGNGDYDVSTLYYFADKILADEDFRIIRNVADMVGEESLNVFGKGDSDAIYVRNDKYSMEYEIIIDEREYADVAPKGVRQTYPEE